MTQEKLVCLECGEPAKWVCYTQFSGDYPYCETCAKKEKDFPEGDGSYSSWDKWPPEESAEPEKQKPVRPFEDRKKIIEKIFPNLKKEQPSRLHQIRKEICNLREETDAKIVRLNEEALGLFEEAPTIEEIAVGQKFLCELYSPTYKKVGESIVSGGIILAIVESGQNKGMDVRFSRYTKVFPVD